LQLAQDHGRLCGRNTVGLLDLIFSELVSFHLGFKVEASLFPSVLSPSDLQQLTGSCYYDTTKHEGQQDVMFTAACIA
jgi:hypothetical protein